MVMVRKNRHWGDFWNQVLKFSQRFAGINHTRGLSYFFKNFFIYLIPQKMYNPPSPS